jgi:diaminohydroxyphosphoribosylaminopyrimidine deaminase/5-amino-6-(5-phosphoribosylamino)uracil reductase
VIVTTDEARDGQPERSRALEAAGAELMTAPFHDLRSAFERLGTREVRSLVLEGGPTMHRAAWRAGLVDRVQVFVTPRVLDGSGPLWDMPPDFSLTALRDVRVTPLGVDVLVEGDVHRVD